MLAKTGLLIVTNPKQIGKILPSVQKQVKKILYIQLLSALTEPFGNFWNNVFVSWPQYSETICGIYSQASIHCQNLDVRVLLSGLKYQKLRNVQTRNAIDLVIFDQIYNKIDIENFVKAKIGNLSNEYRMLALDAGSFENLDEPTCDGNLYKHAVLGGTFDRLHVAHRLLLSEAALISDSKVTVGVTDESMLQGKVMWELIESLDARIKKVEDFLQDICAELDISVVPISDPFGPAITDSTMEVIVVSEETVRGAEKINEIREKNSLNTLDIVRVKLLEEPSPDLFEENKISSSNGRIRLLGTLLRPVEDRNIPKKPYVIGLTGGVASGKSGAAKWLSQRGAYIINCDVVGHEVYKLGKPCYFQLIEQFGKSILTPEGEVNRQALGSIVFQNPEELKKLNNIVWPAIADEVTRLVKESDSSVVVVEAAVLLSAGWEKFCHEIWTTLVPREEAITRLTLRNGLSREQACARINAQQENKYYVKHANVVLCPLWEPNFTKKQVDKAWDLLQKRL